MKAYVVAAPDISQSFTSVYMEYRIGNGFHLYRTERSLYIRGGIMGIDCTSIDGGGKLPPLINEILKECMIHDFSGVLLEIPQSPPEILSDLAGELDSALFKDRRSLFLRESCAKAAPHAKILVGTALSGGSFSRHIQDHASAFGVDRLVLDVERMRMDFLLPAKSGAGVPLGERELDELRRRYRSASFFSKDLCTYYFTYRQNGRSHFVLYDNAYSLKRKLAVAERLGVGSCFFFYPEVSDILDDII